MRKGTPFGRALRKLRVDRGETLADVAVDLNVTPAFLSAIEVGRKNVPNDLLSAIAAHYRLDRAATAELKRLAEQSRRDVTIDMTEMSDEARDVVVMFARRFATLSPEQQAKFKRLLAKEGE